MMILCADAEDRSCPRSGRAAPGSASGRSGRATSKPILADHGIDRPAARGPARPGRRRPAGRRHRLRPIPTPPCAPATSRRGPPRPDRRASATAWPASATVAAASARRPVDLAARCRAVPTPRPRTWREGARRAREAAGRDAGRGAEPAPPRDAGRPPTRRPTPDEAGDDARTRSVPPPPRRRRAAEALIAASGRTSRATCALVPADGTAVGPRPGLLEEFAAVAATARPGPRRRSSTARPGAESSWRATSRPELVLDSLVLAWPQRRRAPERDETASRRSSAAGSRASASATSRSRGDATSGCSGWVANEPDGSVRCRRRGPRAATSRRLLDRASRGSAGRPGRSDRASTWSVAGRAISGASRSAAAAIAGTDRGTDLRLIGRRDRWAIPPGHLVADESC